MLQCHFKNHCRRSFPISCLSTNLHTEDSSRRRYVARRGKRPRTERGQTSFCSCGWSWIRSVASVSKAETRFCKHLSGRFGRYETGPCFWSCPLLDLWANFGERQMGAAQRIWVEGQKGSWWKQGKVFKMVNILQNSPSTEDEGIFCAWIWSKTWCLASSNPFQFHYHKLFSRLTARKPFSTLVGGSHLRGWPTTSWWLLPLPGKEIEFWQLSCPIKGMECPLSGTNTGRALWQLQVTRLLRLAHRWLMVMTISMTMMNYKVDIQYDESNSSFTMSTF